ncbi:MAG: CHAT domain-containing protein, partial [Betaproteobacteria bacterium]
AGIDSSAATPQTQRRAYLQRARIAIETGEIAAATEDLAQADAQARAGASAPPEVDLFARTLDARVAAARGERERAVAALRALSDELAAAPALSSSDLRLAVGVYLAAGELALHRATEAGATLDALLPEVLATLHPADPVRTDAVITRALVDRAEGRFRAAQDRVAAALGEVAATAGTANLAYAQLAWRHALNATVANRPLEAIPALTRAVAWFDDALGAVNPFTRSAREALAYAYAAAERLPEAIALQRAVVSAYAASAQTSPSALVAVRHNLANYLGRDHRYHESEALLDALIVGAPGAGVRPERVAHLELDLAYVLLQTARAVDACRRVQAVGSAVNAGLALPADLASEHALLAALCRVRESRSEGIARLREVVARRVALFGADSVAGLAAQAALARAQMDAGDAAGARTSLEALAATVEAMRRVEAPDATGARNAFAQWLQSDALFAGYRDLAFLEARSGNVARAIGAAEASRGRSLNDAIGVAQDIAGMPTRDQYRAGALLARIREYDAEIALLAPADPARTALEVARSEAAAALDALRAAVAAGARAGEAFDVDRARARLPAATAFVGIEVVHGGVWAYVVRRDRAPVAVMLDAAVPLLGALRPLWTALSSPRTELAPIWRTADGAYVNALGAPSAGARRIAPAALAETLAQALIVPLLPALRGVTSLVVAADGPLAAFPFDALALGGVPLAARFSIRRAPSLRVFVGRTRPASPARHRRDLVAIGAPDYAALTPTAAGPLPTRAWEPLPGASAEIATIAAMFPPDRRLVVAGDAASKARVVELARDGTLATTRYVHVAAHGLLSADAPQWSSIVLADDGAASYLTAAEIATFAIGADVVVLSACETARGKEVAGEGMFGLPYALAVAGARATLLTLWPVADRPTADFMRRFYARLAQGAAPDVALARTKRDFIRSRSFSAPFYWAPFVLYGN